MVGSSTNALERAKKMEILKCAGFVFDENQKSQGKVPFADRLQIARTRLELGLGGHTLSDTILFGAKVLSTLESSPQEISLTLRATWLTRKPRGGNRMPT